MIKDNLIIMKCKSFDFMDGLRSYIWTPDYMGFCVCIFVMSR